MLIKFYDYLCTHYFAMKNCDFIAHTGTGICSFIYFLGRLILEVHMFVFCTTAIRSHFESEWLFTIAVGSVQGFL